MKTAQYQWSQSDGWTPDLPNLEVERQGVVFVFGARPLIQAGELVSELRGHFKGAAILGCSTSGEIVGDTVVDDSVIATAVDVRAYAPADRLCEDRRGEVELRGRPGACSAAERSLVAPCVRALGRLERERLRPGARSRERRVRGRVDHGRPVRGRYRLRRDLGDRQRRSGRSAHRRRRSVRRPSAGRLRIDGRLEAIRAAAHHHPRRGQRPL